MPKTEKPKLRPTEDAQTATSLPWSAAAPRSHIGGRSEQQDARHIFHNAAKGTMLIVVCDGVGGSRSGGEASALVIKTADQLWTERSGVLQNPQRDLLAMSRTAHERICELASAGEKRAPAATLVALYLTPNEAHWVHSGDSRMYRFRDGELVSRTRDHSVVQILLEQGEIAEAEMGNHPDQGRLLQSLGTKDYREPTYGTAQVGQTDSFLLCTDGFWERTPLRAMVDLLSGDSRSLEARLTKAIKNAVSANGQEGDNVTAAAVVPAQGVHLAPSLWKRLMPLALIGVGLLVAAVAFYWSWSGSKPPQKTNLAADVKSVITDPALTTPAPEKPKKKDDLGSTFEGPFGTVFHRITAGENVFYMAETELTESQWDAIESSGADKNKDDQPEISPQRPPDEAKKQNNGNLPKCSISPSDALQWIEKLNDFEKVRGGDWCYSLPTAPEWIATARGPKGDFMYPWGSGERPPTFGNWTPDSGNLKPVGSTQDHPDNWPFKDFVGNVAEIVTIPSGDASGPSLDKELFACLGSAYGTSREAASERHDLSLMAKDPNFIRTKWLIGKDQREKNIGFRLVLARHKSDSEKTAVPPPGDKRDAKDNTSREQPPTPSNL